MAGVQEDDHRADDLVVGQPGAVDSRFDERRHHVVAWTGAPFRDELANVLAELRRCRVRRGRRVGRHVELVHLDHAMRPVEQVALAVERHPEHPADDRDRVRLGVVVEKLHLAGFGQRLEQLPRKLLRRLPQSLDASRRERCGHELPDPGVVGRLQPEEAPALDVPERLPARIQRRNADLLGCQDVAKVASEPFVAQAAANVLVAGDEPAPACPVVQRPRALPKPRESRIRIRQETLVGRVEIERLREPHGRKVPRRPSRA